MTTPIMGEPLPIELANATYAVRGQLRDGLETTADLAAWLEQVRGRLAFALPEPIVVTSADLQLARELRDTVRALAQAHTEGSAPKPGVVDHLNRMVRDSSQWHELRWDTTPSAVSITGDKPIRAALCAIARQTVELFAGPQLADLHACHAPGCVLFFVKDHHRREWCSTACGNRARAARHYHAKTR